MSETTLSTNQSFATEVGLDYAVQLSFTAIDGSTLTQNEKRNLIYSALCFRCVFDNRMLEDVDPLVKKHNCLSYPEPQKLELYELVYKITRLNNATTELKAMWYLMFPYVVMTETPHDNSLFSLLTQTLFHPNIFECVLQSKYSAFVPSTPEEMHAAYLSDTIVIWYLPYISYKAEKLDDGKTREEAALEKSLALGQNHDVYTRTEHLLNSFPDNENFMLLNVAARVALFKGKAEENRRLLQETLQLLDDYLTEKRKREIFFLYYRGLTLLGLMEIKAAKIQFEECLALDPSFSLAKLMLKGIEKA